MEAIRTGETISRQLDRAPHGSSEHRAIDTTEKALDPLVLQDMSQRHEPVLVRVLSSDRVVRGEGLHPRLDQKERVAGNSCRSRPKIIESVSYSLIHTPHSGPHSQR
jgi:hypothetical protein